MKKFALISVLLLTVFTAFTQIHERGVSGLDRRFIDNLHRLSRLPLGTHKIYNGKGSSVFDVLYTIEISNNKRVIYKGGTKSSFDILYTMEYSGNAREYYSEEPAGIPDIFHLIKISEDCMKSREKEDPSLERFNSGSRDEKSISRMDRELRGYLNHIMRLPEGTHKIYNGQGSTVFDVLYTIEISDNKRVIYKGGTKSSFDILFAIEHTGNLCKIYKGSNSPFNIIYTIETSDNGFKVYKGNTSAFGMLYSYERRD